MKARHMARAVIEGLLSDDEETRGRARDSGRKVRALALRGDPEACEALGLLQQAGARIRKAKSATQKQGVLARIFRVRSPEEMGAVSAQAKRLGRSYGHKPSSGGGTSPTKHGKYQGHAAVASVKGKAKALAKKVAAYKKALRKKGVTLRGDEGIGASLAQVFGPPAPPDPRLARDASDIDAHMQDLQAQLAQLNAADSDLQNKIVSVQSLSDSGNPAATAMAQGLTAFDSALQSKAQYVSDQVDQLNSIVDQAAANAQAAADQASAYAQSLQDTATAQAQQQQAQQQAAQLAPMVQQGISQGYGGADYSATTDDGVPDYSSDDSGDYGDGDDSGSEETLGGLRDEILGVSEMLGDVLGDDFALKAGQAAPDAAPVVSSLVSLVPVVGPLLAPLSAEGVKAAGQELVRANGGDPGAIGRIKTTAAQARAGDPDAQAKLDALKRVNAANKAIKGAMEPRPFKWTYRNIYLAGVEGIQAVQSQTIH